jgi:hypothetical protein
MLRKPIASLLSTLALAGQAAGADNKNHPGNACEPRFKSYSYEKWEERVENTSNVSQTWFCPFVKDTNHSFTGNVTVVDGSASASVTCTLISATRTGGTLGRSTVSSSGVAQQTLHFGKLPGISNGHAWVECSLPAVGDRRSSIVAFEIDED